MEAPLRPRHGHVGQDSTADKTAPHKSPRPSGGSLIGDFRCQDVRKRRKNQSLLVGPIEITCYLWVSAQYSTGDEKVFGVS